MADEIKPTVDEVMQTVAPRSRRWCGALDEPPNAVTGAGVCGCMGCCNGTLQRAGYGKADFEAWKAQQAVK